MGLIITTPIGTDQGITNEAYVRIANYAVNKRGVANFSLQIFQSKEDSGIGSIESRNIQIGNALDITLMKEASRTRVVSKLVIKDFEVTNTEQATDEEGVVTEVVKTRTESRSVYEDVDEEYFITEPDLSPLEGIDIFEFAYGKLKDKLVLLFGEQNVIND